MELECRYLDGLYSGWLSRRDGAVGVCGMPKNIWSLFTGSGGRWKKLLKKVLCLCESFSQRYSEKARCFLAHCADTGLVQLCGKWEVMCLKRQLLSRAVFLWITAAAAHQAPLRVSVLEQTRAGRFLFYSSNSCSS